MDIVPQLVRIYLEEEKWHKNKLSEEEAKKYYKEIIKKKNLSCHTNKEGVVIGYIEWFAVSHEQFKRLVNNDSFHIGEEDISNGPICWVNDVWIKDSERFNGVYKKLRNSLFNATKHCEYYTGKEVKRNRRLRIFKQRSQ